MGPGIAASPVREELDRVLRSAAFANAARDRLFLKVIVEAAIEGRSGDLKEYVIGREVFGKPADFDPRIDPIVRVQARRLRTRLKDYYETDGRHDPLRIEIPVGGYSPVFSSEVPAKGSPELPSRPGARRWAIIGPALLIVIGTTALMLRPKTPVPVTGLRIQAITNDLHSKWPRLVTDGLRLYWSETTEFGSRPVQASLATGETEPMPSPFVDARVTDISPDRASLLLLTPPVDGPMNSELWSYSLVGHRARRLSDILAHDATWSPDGSKLAFAAGDAIFIADREGNGARLLCRLQESARTLRWTPRGDGIVFSAGTILGDLSKFEEVETATGKVRELYPGFEPPRSPVAWSPDGHYMVFDSRRDGLQGLFASRDGEEPVRLTSGPFDFIAPVFRADAKKLYAEGGQARGELVRYDLASHRLQKCAGAVNGSMVDYSPDRGAIVYVSYPDESLWRANADGSNRTELVSAARLRAAFPKWSPDGKQIAFSGAERGKPWQLYLVPARGGAPRRVNTGDDSDGIVTPQWSPGGDRILFAAFKQAVNAGTGSRSTGSENLRIYNVAAQATAPVKDSAGRFNQRWWPDGRSLIATDSAMTALWRFDLGAQTWNPILREHADWPAWSRDGRYLYFECLHGQAHAVCRWHPGDARSEELWSLENISRARNEWSGRWFGIDPDGNPLLLRDAGNFQIFALDWPAH